MTIATENTTASRPEYASGFETLSDERMIDRLPLDGELPDWLDGSLLRTGPARFEVGEKPYRHWFDGLTMLHRFSFSGGEVSYGNRFLRGRSWRKAEATGKIPFREFATDPCRSLFGRVQSLFSPGFGDNANINVVRLGERFLSMTEAPISVQFDPRTLEAAGAGVEPPGVLTTAHPHLDRSSKGMLNFAAHLGARTEYRFFRIAPDADEPQVIARIPARKTGYVHSFGLTERHIILAEFPWVLNPIKLALSGRPYAENYAWEPDRGTRIFLIDRDSGEATGPIVTDPMFAFHFVNAYEDADGTIVADLSAFEDASIVERLYLDRLRSGGGVPDVALRRLRIDPREETIQIERLIDAPFELGQINYGRCNERPYRYAWGVGAVEDGWFDTIVRADVEARSELTWSEPGCYPGEPVFVAAPDAAEEDEGVLLSVVLDATAQTSFLLVLDARDLGELCRARVPHAIPFHFHGQFSRGV